MDKKVTKWGILSAGKISWDFVNALKTCHQKYHHSVVAVCARDLKRAQEFAEKFEIPRAYGSESELATNPEIEVVYIGNINPAHFNSVKAMISAGKNVLCEKPMGLDAHQTKEMINMAQEKNVFLMEGVWSRFNPTMVNMLKEIHDDKILGEIIHCKSDLGKYIDSDRLLKKELGGGTILDLGIYCLSFSQMIFKDERPIKIYAQGILNEEGVDTTTVVVLTYSGNRTAAFSTSSSILTPCEAHVYGTRGCAKVEYPFWAPTEYTTENGTKSFKFHTSKIPYNFTNSAALAFEANHVRDCLVKGLKESPVLTFDRTIAITEISDEIRRQLGVTYD